MRYLLHNILSLTVFQKKNCAIFEVTEVLPVMTNNYEESILKGAKVSLKTLNCLNIGTHKIFNFPFGTNGKLLILCV